MPKIGITGSRTWENKLKLKNIIFTLKNKYKDSLDIITGGTEEGVDALVKKICMEFEIEYGEMKPNHMNWNLYCMEPSYMYNRPFSAKNFYIRNLKLIDCVDLIFLFAVKSDKSKVLKNIVDTCQKKNKKLIIITD